MLQTGSRTPRQLGQIWRMPNYHWINLRSPCRTTRALSTLLQMPRQVSNHCKCGGASIYHVLILAVFSSPRLSYFKFVWSWMSHWWFRSPSGALLEPCTGKRSARCVCTRRSQQSRIARGYRRSRARCPRFFPRCCDGLWHSHRCEGFLYPYFSINQNVQEFRVFQHDPYAEKGTPCQSSHLFIPSSQPVN